MIGQTTKKAISICISMNIPFCIYALPNSKRCVFFANPSAPTESKAEFDGTPQFFVNFFNNEGPYTIGIKPEMTAKGILDNLSSLKFREDPDITPWPCETKEIQYYSQVHQIVDGLKKRGGKTVLSRVYCCNSEFNWPNIINAYFENNPGCFRHAYFTRETGCWIGATPEILLDASVKDNSFTTMSLAGTRPISEDNVEWDAKNIEEHNYVTDYIASTLQELGVQYKIGEQENIPFGRIEHLCHKITGNLNNASLEDVLFTLSPTPAVLGYPSKDALTDIERFEVHPRFCYSGFVGICDKKGYHFYVNLRCAHFSQDRVCAYAGGGLTAKSNPNDEWNETFYKLLPLLDTMILHG